jgi:hypothetical protein
MASGAESGKMIAKPVVAADGDRRADVAVLRCRNRAAHLEIRPTNELTWLPGHFGRFLAGTRTFTPLTAHQ